jgi:hypothetical protein
MRKILAILFLFVFFIFMLWIIRPTLQNKLTGTFANHHIPNVYQLLAVILTKDKTFYRTFWVPTVSTYSFYSFRHPQISGEDFLQVNSVIDVLRFLQSKGAQSTLQDMGVKYVIVPFDSEEKIFLTERKYDSKKYDQTITAIQKIPWLHRRILVDSLPIFQIADAKDHIWLKSTHGESDYLQENPTYYHINLKNVSKGDTLVFSEAYDSHWMLIIRENQSMYATSYHKMNSFILPKSGTYTVNIFYQPQMWVQDGAMISCVSLGIILVYLGITFVLYKKTT